MKRLLKEAIKKNYFPRKLKYIVERKIHDRDIAKWERCGKPIPPPHIVKQRTLKYYAEKFNLNLFVETGTYYGDMVEAMKDNFQQIYSIELSEKLYELAKIRFNAEKNIILIQGDSGTALRNLINKIEQPTLFWLDGHYSGGVTAKSDQNTPILQELSHIFNAKVLPHVVIIDDAYSFETDPSYPNINKLVDFIKSNRPNTNIEIKDNIIRILPK